MQMKIRLVRFPSLVRPTRQYPLVEFHILAEIRAKYGVDESLYSATGNVVFPNFRAVRVLAQKINEGRALTGRRHDTVRTGDLNAMGLIDEIYHYVLRLYEESANPKVFTRALSRLRRSLGSPPIRSLLLTFGELFPPLAVYRKTSTLEEYLNARTEDKPHTEVALEEMILLFFANFNPAFSPLRELFDDRQLAGSTAYAPSIAALEKFFRAEKPFGPENLPMFDLLRAPILASPHNLEGQLAYIRKHWGLLLPEKYLRKIASAGDFLREEFRHVTLGGGAPTLVPTYRGSERFGPDEVDIERFTADVEWMPKVIILAKNTSVWLDQLSKKYRRAITRLDQVPDEELDTMARWNITGLWLIGIWERSPASRKIKQLTGNPEAVSSAYSVYEYEVAHDLGGEEAFRNLRHRAWQRGVRLAGDMVPNHTGIYSRWVVEHPEFFVQSGYKPFPNYQFTGPNLSEVGGVDIRIEDGYWSRQDAAVAFQRVNEATGEVRYIYHGNDGTSMPWNDTAQLNFLLAEVREAVVQLILHVARKFSIIRFDAAMTLTKRHFQRLWYPQPGSGGDIPSRADHSMSTGDFNRMFPQEFWREVVDRINHEMPNTLLLAEAFWLLEGYFVRTLGMHRVYNSAFMHMLMQEENSKYRALIKNTLHFNPEILKRYVNFMSNPDEQTAVAQFGKGDKYFGTALLMVTMPGLPMFAHGQIEGFTEKYGMEYRRAYYDEQPDDDLIRRHEREIFPIMQKRHLFSQVAHFELYDFLDEHGNLNENVFAYSNMADGERALICYHNKYAETAGWIRQSVGKTTVPGEDDQRKIRSVSLGEALALSAHDHVYYVFRDHAAGLEYVRSGRDLCRNGLFVSLKAFQYHVFVDFREVHDATGQYGKVSRRLNGRGVGSVEEALREMILEPVREQFEALFTPEILGCVGSGIGRGKKTAVRAQDTLDRLVGACDELLKRAELAVGRPLEREAFLGEVVQEVRRLGGGLPGARVADGKGSTRTLLGVVLAGSLVRHFGVQLLDELRLWGGLEVQLGRSTYLLVKILALGGNPLTGPTRDEVHKRLRELFSLPEAGEFLGLNLYEGTWYFSKERFEELFAWCEAAAGGASCEVAAEILKASAESGYRREEFFNQLLSNARK
jgi:glycosidase